MKQHPDPEAAVAPALPSMTFDDLSEFLEGQGIDSNGVTRVEFGPTHWTVDRVVGKTVEGDLAHYVVTRPYDDA